MFVSDASMRNSGRLCCNAVATTHSDGGIPGLFVRIHERNDFEALMQQVKNILASIKNNVINK